MDYIKIPRYTPTDSERDQWIPLEKEENDESAEIKYLRSKKLKQ
jgi:hypothetical protein